MRVSQRSACPLGRRAEANHLRVVRRWRQALILANLFGGAVPDRRAKPEQAEGLSLPFSGYMMRV